MEIRRAVPSPCDPANNATTPNARGASRGGYIAGFDGLRAIAVGIVIASHAGYNRVVPGGFGVTIFFTISGFLITSILLEEMRCGGSIRFLNFYARRAVRLYPELIAFLIISLLLSPWLETRGTYSEFVSALFYFFNYHQLLAPTNIPLRQSLPWGHLWSLSVEERCLKP